MQINTYYYVAQERRSQFITINSHKRTMNMKRIIGLTISAILAMASTALGSTWSIDTDHSAANFSIAHMAISKVNGSFSAIEGKVEFPESGEKPFTLEISIDPASINTGVAKRDDHLKSPDFFDVTKFPSMTFVTEKVVASGKNTYQLFGTLTMHGVSKSVTVSLEGLSGEAKDPWGNTRKGAKITGKINRKDFGIVYNSVLDNGNFMIGEDVDIIVDLEFIKQ